jgi:hypothetical protein
MRHQRPHRRSAPRPLSGDHLLQAAPLQPRAQSGRVQAGAPALIRPSKEGSPAPTPATLANKIPPTDRPPKHHRVITICDVTEGDIPVHGVSSSRPGQQPHPGHRAGAAAGVRASASGDGTGALRASQHGPPATVLHDITREGVVSTHPARHTDGEDHKDQHDRRRWDDISNRDGAHRPPRRHPERRSTPTGRRRRGPGSGRPSPGCEWRWLCSGCASGTIPSGTRCGGPSW